VRFMSSVSCNVLASAFGVLTGLRALSLERRKPGNQSRERERNPRWIDSQRGSIRHASCYAQYRQGSSRISIFPSIDLISIDLLRSDSVYPREVAMSKSRSHAHYEAGKVSSTSSVASSPCLTNAIRSKSRSIFLIWSMSVLVLGCGGTKRRQQS
jgi:hypothetical protein